MSYVEIGAKELSRMLSIMSAYFGDKEMSEDDINLKKKLEVMYQAEKDWDNVDLSDDTFNNSPTFPEPHPKSTIVLGLILPTMLRM